MLLLIPQIQHNRAIKEAVLSSMELFLFPEIFDHIIRKEVCHMLFWLVSKNSIKSLCELHWSNAIVFYAHSSLAMILVLPFSFSFFIVKRCIMDQFEENGFILLKKFVRNIEAALSAADKKFLSNLYFFFF